MLECCAPLNQIKQKGITFDEFVCLTRCNGLEITAKRGDKITKDEFCKDIKQVCESNDTYMVVSFDRKTLGML